MPHDDDSKYLSDPAPARRKSRAYDEYQDADATGGLDRVGEVDQFYRSQFGKPLPLSNRGQTAYHNRLKLDHRESADISLDPRTPEGQRLTQYMREKKIPYLAFDRAIPGVSSGPHIHQGRASHRLGANTEDDEDAKYLSEDAPYLSTEPASPPARTSTRFGAPRGSQRPLRGGAPKPTAPPASRADLERETYQAQEQVQRTPPAQKYGRVANVRDILTQATEAAPPPRTHKLEGVGAQKAEEDRFARIQAGVTADAAKSREFAEHTGYRYTAPPPSGKFAQAAENAEAVKRLTADNEAISRRNELIDSLTEEDKATIAQMTAEISGMGRTSRGLQTGSQVIGSGLLYKIAGLIDASRVVPGYGPERHQFAEYLRRQAGRGELTVEEIAREIPPDKYEQGVQLLTQALGTLPEIYLATAVAGPYGGFAALGGLEAYGRKESAGRIALETGKGLAYAKTFGVAGQLERPIVPGLNRLGQKLANLPRSLPTIAAGSAAIELGTGGTNAEALQAAITNAAFHTSSTLLNKGRTAQLLPTGQSFWDIQQANAQARLTEARTRLRSAATIEEYRAAKEDVRIATQQFISVAKQRPAADVAEIAPANAADAAAELGPRPGTVPPIGVERAAPAVEQPVPAPVTEEPFTTSDIASELRARISRDTTPASRPDESAPSPATSTTVSPAPTTEAVGAAEPPASPPAEPQRSRMVNRWAQRLRDAGVPDSEIDPVMRNFSAGTHTRDATIETFRLLAEQRAVAPPPADHTATQKRRQRTVAGGRTGQFHKERGKKGEGGFINVSEVNAALSELRTKNSDKTDRELRGMLMRDRRDLFKYASTDEKARWLAGLITGPQRPTQVLDRVEDLGDVEAPRLPPAAHDTARTLGQASRYAERSVSEFNAARERAQTTSEIKSAIASDPFAPDTRKRGHIALQRVQERTTYGMRKEPVTEQSYVGHWSNGSARWDVLPGKRAKGSEASLDANQILIPARSLREAQSIAAALPELPLHRGSFEGRKPKMEVAPADPSKYSVDVTLSSVGTYDVELKLPGKRPKQVHVVKSRSFPTKKAAEEYAADLRSRIVERDGQLFESRVPLKKKTGEEGNLNVGDISKAIDELRTKLRGKKVTEDEAVASAKDTLGRAFGYQYVTSEQSQARLRIALNREGPDPLIGITHGDGFTIHSDPLRRLGHADFIDRQFIADHPRYYRWRYEPATKTVYWDEKPPNDERVRTAWHLRDRGLEVTAHEGLHKYNPKQLWAKEVVRTATRQAAAATQEQAEGGSIAAKQALIQKAARQLHSQYNMLEAHRARRLGFALVNEDIATNYLNKLRKFVAEQAPEKLPLVDKAEAAFHREKFAEATSLSEKALGDSHDYAARLQTAAASLGLIELGRTPHNTTWAVTIAEIRKRMGETGPLSAPGSGTVDISKYPKGGKPDLEKLAYWFEPAIEKLWVKANNAASKGTLKEDGKQVSDIRGFVARQFHKMVEDEFTDVHPLNRKAALAIGARRLSQIAGPVAEEKAKEAKERTKTFASRRQAWKRAADLFTSYDKMDDAAIHKLASTKFPDTYRTSPEAALDRLYRQILPQAKKKSADTWQEEVFNRLREQETALDKEAAEAASALESPAEQVAKLGGTKGTPPPRTDSGVGTVTGEKPNKLWEALANSGREAGVEAARTPEKVAEWRANAEKLMADHGVEVAEKFYQSTKPGGIRTVLGRILGDYYQLKAAETGDPALLAKSVAFANERVLESVELGRAVKAYDDPMYKFTLAGALEEATRLYRQSLRGPAEATAHASLPTKVAGTVNKAAAKREKAAKKVAELEAQVAAEPEQPKISARKPTIVRKGVKLEQAAPPPVAEPVAEPAKPASAKSAGTTASVPFKITKAMEAKLKAKGYSQAEINKMTPQRAKDIIEGYDIAPPEYFGMGLGKLQAGFEIPPEVKAAQARQKTAAKTMKVLEKRVGKHWTRASHPQLEAARIELNAATLELDKLFRVLEQRQQGYGRRLWNLTRSLMVSQFPTASRNAQTQAGRSSFERLTDAIELTLRHSVGLRSDLTYRDIGRNLARPFEPSSWRYAEHILGAFPDQLRRIYATYAGGVDVTIPDRLALAKGIDKVFGGLEEFSYRVNTFNRIQEFHIRSAEFLAELELHTKKTTGQSLEQFVATRGADKLPVQLIQRAVDKALEVTFAANPPMDTSVGRGFNHLIAFGNMLPPTVSPIPFPRYTYNSWKFLYQYNPVGGLANVGFQSAKNIKLRRDMGKVQRNPDLTPEQRTAALAGLAQRRGNIPRAIAQQLIGTAMLTIAYQMRSDKELAGERWYELNTRLGKVDVRPFGPFSTYLFFAEALRRDRNGERKFTEKEWIEAFGASVAGGGLSIATAERLYGYYERGDYDKIMKVVKTEGGDLLRALFTPIRQVKDVIAQFDESQRITRDTSGSPVLGPLAESIPFASKHLPPAHRATSGREIQNENPLVKFITGYREVAPKNFIEGELDRLHFRPQEIRSYTGNDKLDDAVSKHMGPIVDQLAGQLQSSPNYARASDAGKFAILRKAVQKANAAAIGKAAAEHPAEFIKYKTKVPYWKQLLLKDAGVSLP